MAALFICYDFWTIVQKFKNKKQIIKRLQEFYGCSVEKDEEKYRSMIEEAYEEVKIPRYLNDPFPEICLRLAGIRAEQGKQADLF